MIVETVLIHDCEYLLRKAAEKLRKARMAAPRREARLLLARTLGIQPEKLISSNYPVTAPQRAEFEALIERRTRYEPIAYLTGLREFWSLDFEVGAGVLIPRPETETLIEAALQTCADRFAPLRVLDLGTGSGCLLLAFLSERPNASGLGIDRSETALRIAERNARSLGLLPPARFSPGDWCRGLTEQFDVVFANPPYIATAELAHLAPDIGYEPSEALDGGVDGLNAYRRIAAELPAVLAPGGVAFLEIGQGQAAAVEELVRAAKLKPCGTICDLAGIPRCVTVRADDIAQC
jgi:release factor glutamine methyltransferase